MGFNVGDKVRFIGEASYFLTKGKVYTVESVSYPWVRVRNDKGVIDGYVREGFELFKSSPLDEFKAALDNLRDAGYDVTVTMTHTITEEL